MELKIGHTMLKSVRVNKRRQRTPPEVTLEPIRLPESRDIGQSVSHKLP